WLVPGPPAFQTSTLPSSSRARSFSSLRISPAGSRSAFPRSRLQSGPTRPAGHESNLRIAGATVPSLSSLATGPKPRVPHAGFLCAVVWKYLRKSQKAPTFVGAFENLDLNLEYYGQTNPEGRTRLTRRLIMDLIRIIIANASIARSASGF